MPTVLRDGPYRVSFYSHEANEPAHVHVDRDARSAKVWLEPAGLARNQGFPAHELRKVLRLIAQHSTRYLFWRLGMSFTEPRPGEAVRDVRFTDDDLIVDLADGRSISVPLAWYPRLFQANAEQRANWQIAGGGFGIHWPELDEDLSTEGLLRGTPAPAPRRAAAS